MGKETTNTHTFFKMSLSALNGGLWGDFTDVYWISHYLKCAIHVWNKSNDHIMVKI